MHTEPLSMAREGIHEAVIEFLRDKPRGKVLDIPTGFGTLAKRLYDLEFEVICCDVEPGIFSVTELRVDYGDLNGRIPYGDEEFDYICFIEGIEHTENPYNAIREVSRVLKPGGTLIMTTPNYLNIEKRLKFLITGSFTKPISQQILRDVYEGKTNGMHLSPLGYPTIKFALEYAGFQITEISSGKRKRKQVFLKPFVWLVRFYTKLWPKDSRERYWISETSSNEILYGGSTLFIYAKKTLKTG